MALLPLEDGFQDILGKAMRGRKLSPAQVAERAGLDEAQVKTLAEGTFEPTAAKRVAPVLGLDTGTLVAMGEQAYSPAPVQVPAFAQFTTPYDDMMVNSYLAWDESTREAVAFDSGADCSGMLELAERLDLTIKLILITHTHGDHIFDLDRLREKTKAPAFMGDREPLAGAEPFPAGREFYLGALRIGTRLTWGHAKGGITYVISGLARPVAVVGDALFAGSMGGGMVSYEDALHTNEQEIFTLPEETVIASGHGPLTTVGEERRHNPFFAGRV